ncbi:MAG: winged helix-turn-helix transcriptional regulator [Burkholderiales bacterium]|uniref:ArsR/SmtB family transcription factor n=1 Tax=Inhella sp. TaxID=1921806 RepID=UPI001AD56FE1|nr:winged helix-turn-helix transcriptional regulator [Burkholderiales bacterium]
MSKPLEDLALVLADCKPLFFAMAETPRQQILLLLTEHHEMNVGQIAERLPLSRPAISHHLKILRQAGLVQVRQQGTENFHHITPGPAIETMARFVLGLKALND